MMERNGRKKNLRDTGVRMCVHVHIYTTIQIYAHIHTCIHT